MKGGAAHDSAEHLDTPDTPGAPHYTPEPVSKRIGRVAFSEADVAAAEKVVNDVAATMTALIPQGVDKLRTAWAGRGARLTVPTIKTCQSVAHDLSGLGTTLGYPMVTALCRSLCRFFDSGDLTRSGAIDVVDAHVAALHVVVRDRLTGDGGKIGKVVVVELNRAIARFQAK